MKTLYVAEPPPSFRMRPPLVADCSVICALLFNEPTRDAAYAHLEGRALHAPYLLDSEFASVALKKAAARSPRDLIDLALAIYIEQPIEFHRPDVRATCELAARYDLSAYDAAYLWLAASLRAPLATFDRRLGSAAKAHLASLGNA